MKLIRIAGCIFGGTTLGAAFCGYLGAAVGFVFATGFSLFFLAEN